MPLESKEETPIDPGAGAKSWKNTPFPSLKIEEELETPVHSIPLGSE